MDIVLTKVSGSVGTTLCEVVNCVTVYSFCCNWLNCVERWEYFVLWLNCLCLLLFVCCLWCICGIEWIGWQFGKLWEVRDILGRCVNCWVIFELRVLSGFLGCCVSCWMFWDCLESLEWLEWLESWDCWYRLKCWYSLVFWYCWVFCDSWYSLVFCASFEISSIYRCFWVVLNKKEKVLWLYDFWDSQNFRTNYIIWL